MTDDEGRILIERAKAFAYAAHAGQTDKAGVDYIDHPRRVAESVVGAGYGPRYAAAAWLHDVVEDNPAVTPDLLRRAGFPDEVVEAVDYLTKDAEGRLDYGRAVARACRNAIAKVVKAADVADNSDPRRVKLLTDLQAQKSRTLTDKYAHAKEVLAEHGMEVPPRGRIPST